MNKLLKILPIPKGQYSKYRKHNTNIQPHPSLQPLLIHPQHPQDQLKLTEEQIHQNGNEDKRNLESSRLNYIGFTY